MTNIVGYCGCIRGCGTIQPGTKDDLVVLVAGTLKPVDSMVNILCCKPTVAELFCTIHHSSNYMISLFFNFVSLQGVTLLCQFIIDLSS